MRTRRYQSVFGLFELKRYVYAVREGQKIELVPLDARLALPESKFSFLLQDFDQNLAMEEPFAQVRNTIGRILHIEQHVDSLERINRKMDEHVEDIEARLTDISFYRTNLVKCFPESTGKIRYPRRHEMRCCFPNLVSEVGEISPRVVLLLGRQVAEYVLAELDVSAFSFDPEFSYTGFTIDGVAHVPVHHPSYVLIYHRRRLARYVDHICKVIGEYVATPAGKNAEQSAAPDGKPAALPCRR